MMLEIRKGWEQGLDLEMSAGAELTVRAPHSMLAADGGGTPAVTLLLKFLVDKSVGSRSFSFCVLTKCCESPRLKWSTTLITIIVIGSSEDVCCVRERGRKGGKI